MVRARFFHWKLRWFGDRELLDKGKEIPCRECGKKFFAYTHYGSDMMGYVYDEVCQKCAEEKGWEEVDRRAPLGCD